MARGTPVSIGGIDFPRKGDALQHLRVMLWRYSPGDRVSEDDTAFLKAALPRHPEADEKIGAGIDHFLVRSDEYGKQCFWVVRTDSTTDRFSYKSLV